MWLCGILAYQDVMGRRGADVEAKICGQILSGGDPFLLLIPTKILDLVFWWEAGPHIHINSYVEKM